MPSVLKLDPKASSEEEELEFELRYQRGLTTAQRFEMMITRSREMAERLVRLGHRRPTEPVIREDERQTLFELADRLDRVTDVAEMRRVKEELARLTFGY